MQQGTFPKVPIGTLHRFWNRRNTYSFSWKSIDVNKNSYGQTALSLAAREGKEKVVRILLKIPSIDVNIGQEENSKLPNGFNALQWASILGHQGVVKVKYHISL